jgi:hypothetical protein
VDSPSTPLQRRPSESVIAVLRFKLPAWKRRSPDGNVDHSSITLTVTASSKRGWHRLVRNGSEEALIRHGGCFVALPFCYRGLQNEAIRAR